MLHNDVYIYNIITHYIIHLYILLLILIINTAIVAKYNDLYYYIYYIYSRDIIIYILYV